MEQRHDFEWIDYFVKNGYPEAHPLGSGMEGAVYKLGSELIGKVWARRKPDELSRLQGFYTDLASSILPFATPQIYEIRSVDGVAVTFERKLHGTPLQKNLSDDDLMLRPEAVECIIKVLHGLYSVEGTLRMRELAVLDEPQALWAANATWSEALTALMNRKVRQFGSQLRARVSDFDAKYSKILKMTTALQPSRLTAIHGDLCSANILIDSHGLPTAVLDFGFLSNAGDPAFEVSITAGIYNMYGPHARKLDDELTVWLAKEFGYTVELLLLYRAIYAVISSNAYDPTGTDGHFNWCVGVLNRNDVVSMLK